MQLQARTNSTAAAFDDHLAMTARPGGGLTARTGPELSGFGGLLGGFAAALALRAMSTVLEGNGWEPRSLTIQLPAPIRPGPVDLHPRLAARGRSIASASLTIAQDREPVAGAVAMFGQRRDAQSRRGLVMPRVAPPDECAPVLERPVPTALSGALVEHRAAGPLPLTGGAEARVLVWIRLVEQRPIDAALACMLADQTPPGLFGALVEFVAIPSVEIALHFAELPAATRSPWVLGDIRTTHARAGYAIEDAELWTPTGDLILQVRHLRRIVTPTHSRS